MSEITAPRPEVVNGHTDVICSTSIRHILAVRKSTLLQIDTLIRQLAEISAMTESIGGKTARDWAMKQDFRCGCWLMEKPETAMNKEASIKLTVPNSEDLFASKVADTFEEAVDLAIDALDRQLVKLKEKK